jgi:hypothetical protein
MRTFLVSSIVLATIASSLAFGIACGYVVIIGILRAFSHKRQARNAAATAVIATSASTH